MTPPVVSLLGGVLQIVVGLHPLTGVNSEPTYLQTVKTIFATELPTDTVGHRSIYNLQEYLSAHMHLGCHLHLYRLHAGVVVRPHSHQSSLLPVVSPHPKCHPIVPWVLFLIHHETHLGCVHHFLTVVSVVIESYYSAASCVCSNANFSCASESFFLRIRSTVVSSPFLLQR